MTTQNINISKDVSNTSVLEFLIEQYGEKVRELVEKTDYSFAKLKFKGEKDKIAKKLEKMHFYPMESQLDMLNISQYYLQSLVHKELMDKLFIPNKNNIKSLFAHKNSRKGTITYILKLKDSSFELRDNFRAELFRLHDLKPYSEFVFTDIDFLPDESKDSDLKMNELIRLYPVENESKK